MSVSKHTKTLLMAFGAALALAGCGNGADKVVSPGEGAFPPAPPTAPPPTTPPPTTPPPTGGPAADCPTGLANVGTVANGTLRACQLPNLITGNLVLRKLAGTIYVINGQVNVGEDLGGDATKPIAGRQAGILTIEPGVKLFGSAGADSLVINRGSQIYAEGSSTDPIILTSRASVEGQTNIDSMGQWGGLVILGRAPISACPGSTVSGTPECQAAIEGISNVFYGGNAPGDNSGRLRYVRVMYSGFQVSPDNELNGISFGGVGSATTVDHIQVHNSSDDGIEIFGGSVNLRYVVLTGNDDDSLDTDTGWSGAAQFGIVVQRAGGGDRGFEWSAIRRTPYSTPKVSNFTLVLRENGGAGIMLNQGTQATIINSVVSRPTGSKELLAIQDTDTKGTFQSVYFSGAKAFLDSRAEADFNAGTNNKVGASTLTNTFVNGANENAVPAFSGTTSVSPFFQSVSYIGAVRNSSDTWWQGWTCGLTADTACR